MILSVGLVYLAGVLTLRGFAHVYHLRSEHDQRQIAALVKAVPSLPQDTKVVLLPIQLDEHSVRFSTGKESLLDQLLYGVFENPWSAAPAAQMAYKHAEVEAIASNHWDQLHVAEVDPAPDGSIEQIMINGRRVAISQLLAFTYENDRVVLISPLVLVTPTGREVAIPLPLVEQVWTASTATVAMRMRLEPSVTTLQ
jgi:hypothetical protein